jgi:hypothetical protein
MAVMVIKMIFLITTPPDMGVIDSGHGLRPLLSFFLPSIFSESLLTTDLFYRLLVCHDPLLEVN